MSGLQCYRCGESLESLSLPFSRLDECPSCWAHLHCCRMCRCYDPQVPEQCTEDDAEEVMDKARANFCDYFKPGEGLFDPASAEMEAQARKSLDALFGDGDDTDDDNGNDSLQDAEDLFR